MNKKDTQAPLWECGCDVETSPERRAAVPAGFPELCGQNSGLGHDSSGDGWRA